MLRFLLILLLVMRPLAAAPPPPGLDLHTELGTDPATQVMLVPPGIWNGLLVGTRAPKPPVRRRRARGEATVEVTDFALPNDLRAEAFRLFRLDLHQRLFLAFQAPPPSHGQIELSELMHADPARPQDLGLTQVQSLQNRFNRLPPSGSPLAGR